MHMMGLGLAEPGPYLNEPNIQAQANEPEPKLVPSLHVSDQSMLSK